MQETRTGRAKARAGKKKKSRLPFVLALIGVVIIGAVLYIAQRKPPLDYVDTISHYASEYDLDPYLVAAVIDTESGFRADAVSRVGARGLMQIMPDTAEWIAKKIGPENFTADQLFDPDVNIRYGCWYLRFLFDRFQSRDLVAAAYNAGHGRVNDWLEDESITDDSGNLVNIPYEETSKYVEKIAKTQAKYEKDYPEVFHS